MKGMRVKGTEFDTSFGPLTASKEVSLPLSRLQRYSTTEHEIPGTNLSISGFGRDINGNSVVYVNTPNQRRRGIQIGGMNAVEEAMKQGMEFFTKADPAQIAEIEQEILDYVQKYETGKTKEHLKIYPKQAAIYDNYGTRVTIETKARDTNESYTMVLSMLKGADILYREVKRYTINPDRVVLEVLVRNQDLDVIKELAKEAEKEGVKIYLSENISESLYPKTIVAEEEEVEKKVEAAKKTATTGNEWASMFQDVGINIGQADILWDRINKMGGGSLTFDNYVSAENKSETIATLSKLADALQLALASVTVLSGAISDEGSEPKAE